MKITNRYKKLREQIKSFTTWEIIEPKRKFFENNTFYPLSIFFWEYLGRQRNVNRRNEFAQKKTP